MLRKMLLLCLLAVLFVAGPAAAQSLGCDDLSDPGCDVEEVCDVAEVPVEEEEIFSRIFAPHATTLPNRVGQCSGNATDSDGKNPLTAGCLTYWNGSGCAAPAVGNSWDYCSSPTTLVEVYTTHADKKSCASPSLGLSRDCETWLDWQGITCPQGSSAVCVAQPINCGGAQRQGGFCACTTPPNPGTDKI